MSHWTSSRVCGESLEDLGLHHVRFQQCSCVCPLLLPGSDVSVREESDTDPNQSDEAEAETSPTKSPTTPKSIKCKNSSGNEGAVRIQLMGRWQLPSAFEPALQTC